MSYERLIKRTVYIAKCECGNWRDVKADDPPRERQCPECRRWVPYVEQSAIGPDLVASKP